MRFGIQRERSADRLRKMLAANAKAGQMYQTEALYKVQADYTCDLLDAVDTVTDEITALMITSVIYEKLTGDGVLDAAKRQRETAARMIEFMKNTKPIFPLPDL